MRFAPLVLAFATSSCIGFNIIPTGGGSSGSKDAAVQAASDASDAEAGVTGVSCGADPDTGVTLCLGISTCPGLTIDSALYPGCGFRVHAAGDVIDLECACYGLICPIGVASTCDQAVALMKDQSQYTVCMQVNEGRCTSK